MCMLPPEHKNKIIKNNSKSAVISDFVQPPNLGPLIYGDDNNFFSSHGLAKFSWARLRCYWTNDKQVCILGDCGEGWECVLKAVRLEKSYWNTMFMAWLELCNAGFLLTSYSQRRSWVWQFRHIQQLRKVPRFSNSSSDLFLRCNKPQNLGWWRWGGICPVHEVTLAVNIPFVVLLLWTHHVEEHTWCFCPPSGFKMIDHLLFGKWVTLSRASLGRAGQILRLCT